MEQTLHRGRLTQSIKRVVCSHFGAWLLVPLQGAAAGCRCKVLLSECCLRFGACLVLCRQGAVQGGAGVPLQDAAARCCEVLLSECCLRFGALRQVRTALCDSDPAKAFECCPRIPFAIWGLCWYNCVSNDDEKRWRNNQQTPTDMLVAMPAATVQQLGTEPNQCTMNCHEPMTRQRGVKGSHCCEPGKIRFNFLTPENMPPR